MTVPFIMALGVGVSAIRSDRHAADDSFGLVALCSVGPILAVLILGIVFHASESSYMPPVIPEVGDSVELWQLFSEGLPTYLHEIATSLLPIVVMFGIFQLAALHIDRRTLGRIGVGLVYTYIGLVLFLTGANIGFMPAGNYLGQVLGGQSSRWLLIPIGMLIGYFIVRAEPAVYVLNKQVEEVTDGAISAGTMGAASRPASPSRWALRWCASSPASRSCGSSSRATSSPSASPLWCRSSTPPSPLTPAAWPPAP